MKRAGLFNQAVLFPGEINGGKVIPVGELGAGAVLRVDHDHGAAAPPAGNAGHGLGAHARLGKACQNAVARCVVTQVGDQGCVSTQPGRCHQRRGNCAAALAVVNGKDMGGAVLRRILLNNADGILAAMAYPNDPFRYLHDDAPYFTVKFLLYSGIHKSNFLSIFYFHFQNIA